MKGFTTTDVEWVRIDESGVGMEKLGDFFLLKSEVTHGIPSAPYQISLLTLQTNIRIFKEYTAVDNYKHIRSVNKIRKK